jgi:GNAT superfamily N-acetyltransferase
MQLEYSELGKIRKFKSAELQLRANSNPWTEHRLQFSVLLESVEVAYLSFDLCSPAEGQHFILLYELWVEEKHRGKGVGTQILEDANGIASKYGYDYIRLNPRSLSAKYSNEQLFRWYESRGFQRCADSPTQVQKPIQKP